MIVVSIIVTTIIMVDKFSSDPIGYEIWLLLFIIVGYGLIGFLDDFIIIALKRNLGLTSKQKMIGQLVIALIFYFILRYYEFPTYIQITGTSIQLELEIGRAHV